MLATILQTHPCLCAGMQALITMLPSPSAVEEVYCGAHGALAAQGGVRPPLLLDCSTIDSPTARRVAEAAEATPLHPEVTCPQLHTNIGRRLMLALSLQTGLR